MWSGGEKRIKMGAQHQSQKHLCITSHLQPRQNDGEINIEGRLKHEPQKLPCESRAELKQVNGLWMPGDPICHVTCITNCFH